MTVPNQKFTNDQYEAIAAITELGDWFCFSRRFISDLGLNWEEAGILQHLMNVGAYNCGISNRWFRYSPDEMENDTRYKRDAQQRILNVLASRGFISISKAKSTPPHRVIRIERVAIANATAEMRMRKEGSKTDIVENPKAIDGAENTRTLNGKSRCLMNGKSRCLMNGISRRSYIDSKDTNTKNSPAPQKAHIRSAHADVSTPAGEGKFFASTEDKTTSLAKQWARRLHEVICKDSRMTVSSRNWDKAFRLLYSSLTEDATSRIESVLSWYEKNWKTAFTEAKYRIFCADKFAKRFAQLEGMSETAAKVNVATVPSAPRDSDTAEIVKELRRLRWPKGSDSQLQSVVDDSLVFHNQFRKTLLGIQKNLSLSAQKAIDAATAKKKSCSQSTGVPMWVLPDFIETLLNTGTAFRSSSFVRKWFEKVYEEVAEWEKWSGKLSSYTVSLESERFQKMGADQSTDYCGDSRRWDMLMEELK